MKQFPCVLILFLFAGTAVAQGDIACGGTDDTSLLAAADGIAKSITIAAGTVCASNAQTLHAQFRIDRGGFLKPIGTSILTLTGDIDAGQYQIFQNARGGTEGKINFAGNTRLSALRSNWWEGVIGDGTTNARSGLQAWLQANHDMSGGAAMELGPGKYVLTGTVDASTRSALRTPSNLGSAPITYDIRGTCPGAPSDAGVNTRCTTIDASAMTDSEFYSSVIAGNPWTTDYGTANNIHVFLRNLHVINAPNALGGINCHNVKGCEIENVFVGTTQPLFSQVEPTAIRYGIIMPVRGNQSDLYLKNTLVSGYYVGYYHGEHETLYGRNTAFQCKVAHEIRPADYPVVGMLQAAWTNTGISQDSGNEDAAPLDVTLDIEDWITVCAAGCTYTSTQWAALFPQLAVTPTPSGTTPAWYQATASNSLINARGVVRYTRRFAGDTTRLLPLYNTNSDSVAYTNKNYPVLELRMSSNIPSAIANATVTTLGFNIEELDSIGGSNNNIAEFHATSVNNDRVLFGRGGTARFCAQVIWDSASYNGDRYLVFQKNATTDYGAVREASAIGGNPQYSTCADIPVAAGDIVRVRVFQSSGGWLNVNSARATMTLRPSQ